MSDEEKLILDCTCGGRTIWFQKDHPNCLYTDIREMPAGFDPSRPKFKVAPDAIMDYRDMDHPDESFYLVVWDPPHIKNLSPKSWFYKKYGSLNGETWAQDIKQGFIECMRVLKPNGTLIIKWSHRKGDNRTVSLKEFLSVIPETPLFGHTTGSNSHTYWMTFMKIIK
ncbi:MAG: SAM-dependent methyltransferase [Elusimicrobiota bacterium]